MTRLSTERSLTTTAIAHLVKVGYLVTGVFAFSAIAHGLYGVDVEAERPGGVVVQLQVQVNTAGTVITIVSL